MKRLRATSMPGTGTGTGTAGSGRLQNTKAGTKKKAAKTRGKEEGVGTTTKAEVVMVGGGGGRGNQMKIDAEFVAAAGGEWDDDCWSCSCASWVAVDEQMSWGTCWSPSWDVEFIGGEAYHHALYDDVVWEDDIWDLKDIKNVPTFSSIP